MSFYKFKQEIARQNARNLLIRLKRENDRIRLTKSPCERDHCVERRDAILAERSRWNHMHRLRGAVKQWLGEHARHAIAFVSFFLNGDRPIKARRGDPV